jgi:hypothetical protein
MLSQFKALTEHLGDADWAEHTELFSELFAIFANYIRPIINQAAENRTLFYQRSESATNWFRFQWNKAATAARKRQEEAARPAHLRQTLTDHARTLNEQINDLGQTGDGGMYIYLYIFDLTLLTFLTFLFITFLFIFQVILEESIWIAEQYCQETTCLLAQTGNMIYTNIKLFVKFCAMPDAKEEFLELQAAIQCAKTAIDEVSAKSCQTICDNFSRFSHELEQSIEIFEIAIGTYNY